MVKIVFFVGGTEVKRGEKNCLLILSPPSADSSFALSLFLILKYQLYDMADM